MLTIDILRHGESTLSHTLRGSTDDALTPLGWQQMQNTIMQAVATGTTWDVIFSSPLQRCQSYAQEVAQRYTLPLKIHASLQEMHFGDWEGQSTQQIYEEMPELLANFWQYPTQFSTPNGETLQAFERRILLAVQQITQQMKMYQWKNALLISHGGVIKLLKCHALAQPLDDVLTMSAAVGTLHTFEYQDTHLKMRNPAIRADEK